jgi:hypothetical protein
VRYDQERRCAPGFVYGYRLAFLRTELAKLARDYPEQAERLRIPASLEAIAGRVGVATGER